MGNQGQSGNDGASAPFVRLAAAPHRLMFFVGAGNVLLAMAWWAAWLSWGEEQDARRVVRPS